MLKWPPGQRVDRGTLSRWKCEVSFPFQLEHQATTDDILEVAVGLDQIPGFAYLTG